MSPNRRDFLSNLSLAAGATIAGTSGNLLASNIQMSKKLPSLKGKKILFTYGGWKGHEPIKFKDYLIPWLKEEGATVIDSDKLDVYTDESLMKDIDLVVQIFTMDEITKEQEAGLLKAIRENGTGFAGWHGGMCDAFRNNVKYQYMTGGQWVAHPGNFIDYTVNIIDSKDDVTKGIEDFKMHSEQYFMHVDPNVKVLATTTFSGDHDYWIDGSVMPVVWKKMYGKGRIFFSSLGHILAHVIDQPNGMKIIKRGIQWASDSKYGEPLDWVNPIYAKK